VGGDIPDSQALLSYAADSSADLIVAGAYGHSRAREFIFGGVTRTLLREMTMPVFFSH
jgi:nucleotide-binding universal stress UspA family protein